MEAWIFYNENPQKIIKSIADEMSADLKAHCPDLTVHQAKQEVNNFIAIALDHFNEEVNRLTG